MPAEQWPSAVADVPLWSHFVEGRTKRDASAYRKVLAMPDLESRHYLKAWHELRSLGIHPPPDQAKQVLGVVIEVALEDGLDLLAAYADHSARYFNFSGSAVIWERPDPSLDELIDAVLAGGRAIAGVIGPWEGPRPPAPPTGHARLNLLTPSGLHFGQGPMDLLANDPLAGPLFLAGAHLMQALIAKAQ